MRVFSYEPERPLGPTEESGRGAYDLDRSRESRGRVARLVVQREAARRVEGVRESGHDEKVSVLRARQRGGERRDAR